MSEIDNYRESIKAFEQARAQLEELVAIVVDGSRKLQAWQNTGFSNMGGISFPSGTQFYIDGSKWPSAQTLAAALAAVHQAHQAVKQAWGKIGQDDREVLIPPPPLRQP